MMFLISVSIFLFLSFLSNKQFKKKVDLQEVASLGTSPLRL